MFCQLIQKIILFNHIHIHVALLANNKINAFLKINIIVQNLISGMSSYNQNKYGDNYDVVDMEIGYSDKEEEQTHPFKRIVRSFSTDRYKEEKTDLPRSQSQIHLGSVKNYEYQNNFQEVAHFPLNTTDLRHHCLLGLQSFKCGNGINMNGNNFLRSNKNVSYTNIRHYKKDKRNILQRKWDVRNINNNGFLFSLMSYNVLAQDLLDMHPYLYKNNNKNFLKWEVRWLNILKEIGEHDPDILCFQEVQESHIQKYFSIFEKQLGYKYIYKKRTGGRTDGCAIFYKTKKLCLMEYQKVEYFHQDVSILNRDNVAIVARFIPKEAHANAFVVATTHLLYNPNREDVRLAQVLKLLAEVDKMAYRGLNNNGSPSYLPVIITGDLNANPKSAIYDFLTNGFLNYEFLSKGRELIPKKLRMTDNCQYVDLVKERNQASSMSGGANKKLMWATGTLTHDFCFSSTYSHYLANDYEATTFQNKWVTVDYIFYSCKKINNNKVDDKLKVTKVYQLPLSNDLKGISIPNNKCGSDHISLLVQFSLE